MIRINQQLRMPLQHPLQQFVEEGKGTEIGEKIHSFQFITQDLIFQDEKKEKNTIPLDLSEPSKPMQSCLKIESIWENGSLRVFSYYRPQPYQKKKFKLKTKTRNTHSVLELI